MNMDSTPNNVPFQPEDYVMQPPPGFLSKQSDWDLLHDIASSGQTDIIVGELKDGLIENQMADPDFQALVWGEPATT
jgi:hypothetical protein